MHCLTHSSEKGTKGKPLGALTDEGGTETETEIHYLHDLNLANAGRNGPTKRREFFLFGQY